MKKVLFLFCILCLSRLNAQNNIIYIVGSNTIPGYAVKTCFYSLNKTKINLNTSAPILQVYAKNKKEFIGGTLENNKGEKTIIVDIQIVLKNNEAFFAVIGTTFSESLTSSTGTILKEEIMTTTFYTEKHGIWKITRVDNILSH